MITKLPEDYMVSGMIYRKTTSENKMVLLEVNIENMTIGYKNSTMEINFIKQFGFKQVFTYEAILLNEKIKKGFKITCSEGYFEFFTNSGKEYEIWMQGLKDYFIKKLRREKQIAKELTESGNVKLGTDIKTKDKFDTHQEFTNWEYDEEEDRLSGKRMIEIKQEKVRRVKKEYKIESYEITRYNLHSLRIENPISIIIHKKIKRPDLFKIIGNANIIYPGLKPVYDICYEEEIEILRKNVKLHIEKCNNFLLNATPHILRIKKQETFSVNRIIQPLVKCRIENLLLFPTPKIFNISSASKTCFSVLKSNFELLRRSLSEFFYISGTKITYEAETQIHFEIKKKKPILKRDNREHFEIINKRYKKPRLEFDNHRNEVVSIISTNKTIRNLTKIEKIDSYLYYDKNTTMDIRLNGKANASGSTINCFDKFEEEDLIKYRERYANNNHNYITNENNYYNEENDRDEYEENEDYEDGEQIIRKINRNSNSIGNMDRDINPILSEVTFISQRYKFREKLLNTYILKY